MTNQFSSAPRFLTSTRLHLALVALLVGSFSVSVAQEEAGGEDKYDEIKTIEKYDRVSKPTPRNEILNRLRENIDLDPKEHKEFFDGYVFAEMTQLDKHDAPRELDKKRVDFFKTYITPQNFEKIPHDTLVGWTQQKMEEISSGNFHPAVRFNALLIIGQLNNKESVGSQVQAEPLPAALDFLVAQLEKSNKMDALQLAAWIGILRHTTHARHNAAESEYVIVDANKTKIRNLAIALLKQRKPPANRSRDGHVWLQRRAIEVLGTLGKDPTIPVINEITFYMSDEDSPMSLRLTAARSLADFIFDPKTKINAVAEAHALGALAVEVCRIEIDRVVNSRRRKNQGQGVDPGGSGNMGSEMESMMADGPGGSGGGDTVSREPDVKPEEASRVQDARRRLKYQLFHIQQGLHGLIEAADGAGKAEVNKVLAAVNEIMDMEQLIIKKMAKPKSGDREKEMNEKVKLNDMIKHVRLKERRLDKIVENAKKSGQPGAAPAPPAGDVPGSD